MDRWVGDLRRGHLKGKKRKKSPNELVLMFSTRKETRAQRFETLTKRVLRRAFLAVVEFFRRQVVKTTEGQGHRSATETEDVERHTEVGRGKIDQQNLRVDTNEAIGRKTKRTKE